MDLQAAKKIALDLAKRLDGELIELGSALGRVVAEPISAGQDIPGSPRSKWDGFALSSGDSQSAAPQKPVILEIAPGETTAGKKPAEASSGRCFRIMTGGVLPAGADVVIPYEEATPGGEGLVLRGALRPGSGVIARGSEARRDEILLKEGDILTPTRLALAAATGRQALCVTRRPRVAILATGDELREAGCSDEAVCTFCSHNHLFANLIRVGGAEPVDLGAVPDDPGLICSRLEQAEADLVITTGGMGKGSRDYISEVWKRLGLRTHFDRLNLIPGKASALGTGNGRIFLGLPGRPRAARIVYEEFAAPMIRRFLGLRARADFTLDARTLAPIRKKEGFYLAVEGVLEMRGWVCSFAPNQSGPGRRNGISSLRSGMAYALLAPRDTYVPKGKRVQAKVPDFTLLNWAVLDTKR